MMILKGMSTQGLSRRFTGIAARLFLCFFLVSTAVLFITFYATRRADMQDSLLASHVSQVTQDLLRANSTGSPVALDNAHDLLRSTLRINAYVVQNRKSLGSRPMPAAARERIGELRAGQEARFAFDDGGMLIAVPIKLSATAVVSDAHALLFGQRESDTSTSRQSLLYLQLIALLCAAGIVGWLAARALTAPIRQIQRAVNLIADGKLHARVGGTVHTGVHELTGLAHDIDNMASQMQAMNTSRDRLLHHLSHEMRSPLARLRILLELLREEKSSGLSTPHKRLNSADKEIDRLDAMIDEILGLARLEACAPPPMTAVSMKELIKDCVESSSVEANVKAVQLTLDVGNADASDCVHGNRELIVRAVDNLLRNAIRHTPANHVVAVALTHTENAMLLSVDDQGPGVAACHLQAIFEPFFRLPATNLQSEQPSEKGYGLGLTYVRLITKLHGATVAASNKVSGGLLISIGFPTLIRARSGDGFKFPENVDG
jgi:two-component system, OmpR family, sensor kinase